LPFSHIDWLHSTLFCMIMEFSIVTVFVEFWHPLLLKYGLCMQRMVCWNAIINRPQADIINCNRCFKEILCTALWSTSFQLCLFSLVPLHFMSNKCVSLEVKNSLQCDVEIIWVGWRMWNVHKIVEYNRVERNHINWEECRRIVWYYIVHCSQCSGYRPVDVRVIMIIYARNTGNSFQGNHKHEHEIYFWSKYQ